MEVQLSDIWVAAGIILGFQITWFSWRISREIQMRKRGERTWLPPADIVNLVSMSLIIVGVFILPIFGFKYLNIVKYIFALAVFLIVGHAFALAGHYQLFNKRKKKKQPYCSSQERNVLFILAILTAIYIVLCVIIG